MNGKTASIGDHAEPGRDVVTIDGEPLPPPRQHEYIMLNKPAGYACTRYDPHLPETIYDLLPHSMGNLFTVGRLDVDTEGLLLLTNDGAWGNGIAHPSTHIPKSYLAEVFGYVTADALDLLRRGVPLEDGVTHPAQVRETWARPREGRSRLQITITEGRKRQVRRMLDYVGLDVERLVRTRIGGLSLGELPLGRWRHLDPAEVESLRVETPA